MKNLIFSLVIVSSVAHASRKEIAKWTSARSSVQVILYKVLETAQQLDADSAAPQKTIVKKDNALLIKTAKATLSCETKSEKYRCLVKGPISTWTEDAESVQAVLYDAFEVTLDQEFPEFGRAIRRSGAGLTIRDGKSRLSCFARTLGTAQVQAYACIIK